MIALPFIPEGDVIEVFLQLHSNLPQEVLPLWRYIDATYVRGTLARGRRRPSAPKFPPSTWSVYSSVLDKFYRTNNNVEGWHLKFSIMIRTAHSNIWKFLEYIKKDENDNRILILQLAGGHTRIRYPIKKSYAKNEEHIENIVRNYNQYKADDNLPQYLRAISYRLKRPAITEEEIEEEEYI